MKRIMYYITPEGFSDMIMKSDGEYLTELVFDYEKESKTTYSVTDDEGTLPVFAETKKWLDLYFSGKKPNFIPKLKIENLTDFRREVIECMMRIPYGSTISYGEIASEIAAKRNLKRMSAQAVGGAVGWNPICIIIPCHRVIGADGKLTGYGGGIENKIALLKLEKA